MSGHSRWSQIKRKKGKTDVQRGKLFSKILREITVAAKNGGGDPKGNLRLKAATESARAANMPADNIKRAIQKGTGELPGESYDEIAYEGYGAGGVAVMVRTLTDNKNRTGPEIRHIFEKNEGRMGTAGCVAWMFDRRGLIEVDAQKVKEDDLLEKALESGATDVRQVEKVFEVTANPDEMEAVRQALERQGMPVVEARVDMVPQSTVKVEGKEAAAVLRLIEALEEQDDVQSVYSNYDIADEVINTITAQPLEARLNALHRAVHRIIELQGPGLLVVEDLYTEYKFPRTAILMGHARGVIYLAARQLGVAVVALAPSEVKRAMTGNGAAGKAQVQRAVQTVLGLKELPRPSHVADALGLAATGMSRMTGRRPFVSSRTPSTALVGERGGHFGAPAVERGPA